MNTATKRQSVTRKSLLTALIEPSEETSRVEIKQIDFAPGQMTAPHSHSCPLVGYITRGSVTFQVEGGPQKTLYAGEAFFEPANTSISHFDNVSATEPLTFIAFYLLDEHDEALIRMLA